MKSINILSKLISFLLTITLFIVIAFIFYFSMPIKTTKKVVLPKGSVTKVVEHLKKQGYKLTVLDTYLLAYLLDSPKSGTLLIGGKEMSRIAFLKKLSSAKEAVDVVTLIPGETKVIFLEELAKNQALDVKKLNRAYDELSSYKEAGILPETYHLPKDIDEKKLIKILVRQSEMEYQKLSKKYLKEYNKKEWNKVLTIASIIQKEAANKEEMPIIASVIYNRLKIGMALQMDGTLNYGKYSHIKVTPKRIKTDKSGFNTYLHRGLPPYPVCSVSKEAILATLKPKQTEYLYFMKNKSGVHDFTSSYQEHLRNINRAK